MVQKIVIYGAGETGISIAEWMLKDFKDKYNLVGFLDDKKTRHDYPVPILGSYKDIQEIKDGGLDHIVLGFVYPVEDRLRKGLEMLDMGFQFPSLHEPGLEDKFGVSIGKGVLIYHATINPNVKLGNFVCINAYSDIEASEIGDGVIITSQVFIGAGSSILEGTLIYPGARILPNVRVGKYCIIGPNSVVHKDLNDRTEYLRANHRK